MESEIIWGGGKVIIEGLQKLEVWLVEMRQILKCVIVKTETENLREY